MYCIETQTLTLKMEVVRVASLFRHEAVIPRIANKLILEFKNLASLQNPIIVDENHVILDGNHRAHAFDVLKFNFIPVCKIDYFNDCTRLRYWFRLLGNVENFEVVQQAVEKFGGVYEPIKSRGDLKKRLGENCLTFGVQRADTYAIACFSNRYGVDPVDVYQVIQDIQDTLAAQGVTLSYVPCKTVHKDQFCNTMKPDELVIWTPQITKEMVTDAARQGRVFAPKTTRHVIPVRPLNVNVPVRWFAENVSLNEINHRFEAFLETKKIRKFSPGLVLDGRYYEEELVVFYD
jgi:hypothetical protein